MASEKRTSIPCSGGVRDYLKELKEESGKDWDSFLLDLAESKESTTDNSIQFNSSEIAREVSRELDYSELANQVADELEVRMGK